ncbi:MAG: Uma2 family endonuclease [Hyphomonadaceae bacterium]|nr:Uma2 family endonuclease [Hyphomonadaceae bacterium]
MNALLPILEPTRHKITFDELMSLVDAGFFAEPSRIELIDGVITEMPHEGFGHMDVKNAIAEWLIQTLPKACRAMIDTTLQLSPHDAPSPDAWIYERAKPLRELKGSDILLIIETADSSLEKDRGVKAPLYARFGIQEYWIVDLEKDEILVYRPAGEGIYGEPEVIPASAPAACTSIASLSLTLADLPRTT